VKWDWRKFIKEEAVFKFASKCRDYEMEEDDAAEAKAIEVLKVVKAILEEAYKRMLATKTVM